MYIFDIDGTILNTIDSISFYLNKTFKHFSLGEVPTEMIRSFVGNGPVVLINNAIDFVGGDIDPDFRKEVLNLYNKSYDENPMYLTKPYEGIKEALDTIKGRGEILTAFSNKPDDTSNKVLNEIFGKGYFDFILGYKDTYQRKPSPEGIYIIAERFNANFSDILYFGDSEVDMKCGKNASIFTIGCTWGFRDKEILEREKPNLIIDYPKEITTIRRI